jgi:hypothetical protein
MAKMNVWVEVYNRQEKVWRARSAEYLRLANLTEDHVVRGMLEQQAQVAFQKATAAQDNSVEAQFGHLYAGAEE